MFEQLMQAIQQHGQDAVVNNTEVPNEHNEGVMAEAQNSIISVIQKTISSGNMSQITDLLGGNNNGDLMNNIQGSFAGNIAEKFGINAASAQSVAGNLIPGVLNSVTAGLKNGGGIDLQNILGSLTGGNTAGIQNTVNSIGSKFGLDKDGDGDVDLSDITKMF